MTPRDDEREWVPRHVTHRSSFGLHHCNLRLCNVDEESIKSSGIEPSQVPWLSSKRFRLSVLCFLGLACLQAQRVNLSISMVCMVNFNYSDTTTLTPVLSTTPSLLPLTTNTSGQVTLPDSEQCPLIENLEGQDGAFDWDKQLQGLLLAAFFLGYLAVQIPAVILTERFGAKKMVAVGMFPVAILTVITPLVPQASPYLLFVVRVLVGMGEGLVYPAIQGLWSTWSPPWERGKLLTTSLSGEYVGTALMFPIGSLLCKSGFAGGWPSMFYSIGVLSFLWCVIWTIFVHDKPDSNIGISDVERKYIAHSLEEYNKLPKPSTTPWKSMFASGAVWALVLVHMSGSFSMHVLLTQMPTFMKEVLRLQSTLVGVYCMIPYLCYWACSCLGGLLADFFIFRDILSVKWTRKVLTIIGLVGGAISLIILGQIDCSQVTAGVVLLCVSVGLSGFNISGYFINHADIAPAFAGTLFGISNTAAGLSAFLGPYITGLSTPGGLQEEWQSVLYISAGVNIFGALVYFVFGTGKQRYWSKIAEKSKDETVALRKSTVNGHRKSRWSMRTTYFDNEESHVTIECDPEQSYAESAIV